MVSDAAVEGISGAIGGIVATMATFPLMRISTLQATRVKKQPLDDAEKAAQSSDDKQQAALPPTLRAGMLQELSEVVRTSGWQALFAGLDAALVGTTVSQGVYFYLYSALRQAAVRRRSGAASGDDLRAANVTVAESLLVASMAGCGNVLLTNPIWMVATRMQAHKRATQRVAGATGTEMPAAPPGPVAVARDVFQEYGVRGFWNGVGASLIMVINPTIQYALYEWLSAARAKVRRQRPGAAQQRASALEVFGVSAVAKAGATLLTYPLLTIKMRMMSARKSDADMQYTSVSNAVLQIYQREGLAGYYQGIHTKIVQSVLAASLLFMCKEKITELTREMLAPPTRERETAK